MTKTIGIRALRQNAGGVLRRVEQGDAVEVTDRGRRVAWIVPAATKGTPLELLQSSGRLVRSEGDVLVLGLPIRIPRGKRTASRRLADMRANER